MEEASHPRAERHQSIARILLNVDTQDRVPIPCQGNDRLERVGIKAVCTVEARMDFQIMGREGHPHPHGKGPIIVCMGV